MRFPAFMFWPERYWLDTYDLSDAGHGIYLRLLLLQWNAPACKLPNDDGWLAGKMQRSPQAIEEQVRPIITRYFKSDGNWIWQAKLLKEFDRLCRLSARGTVASKSRWNKGKEASLSRATDTQQAMRPTPIPTPIIEEDIVVARARDARRLALDTEFNLTFWPAYPLKIARKAALEAFYTARGSASLTAIMAGLETYSALLKGPDPPRAKHASGWLNGERWTDDNTPQVNGAQHDRRNGYAPSGKLGPGDATFAGFAIALDKAERRDRELEQAANSRAGSNTTQSLLASERHTGGAKPSGRRLDRRP